MIRIVIGLVLGMGGVGMVEASLDSLEFMLGVCISLLGVLSILWKVAE